MAKEFQRGSFRLCKMPLILDFKYNSILYGQNVLYLKNKITNFFKYKINHIAISQALTISNDWGAYTPYLKVMIIRGIGYRTFFIENDFLIAKGEQELKTSSLNFSNFDQRAVYDRDNAHITPRDSEEDDIHYWARASLEFPYSRYLVVRAGHTEDLYLPLEKNVFIKTSKKDRKMIIYGPNKQQVNNLARSIFNYRPPSVYTGRGIRRKHLKPIRKEGKKDKQKGKSF
jgi:hypothetical protein